MIDQNEETDLCVCQDAGKFGIHVPSKFTPKRPAVRFFHTSYDIRIEEHPLARRLFKETGEVPSIHKDCAVFRSFNPPVPNNIKHYLTTDEPLVSLSITSFTNATIVSITHSHILLDAMGTAALLRAWSDVLAEEYDRVPVVAGANEDILEKVATTLDTQTPYILQDKQLNGMFSMLVFGARLGWDILTRRNEAHTIYVPAKFVSHLRRAAAKQLTPDPSSQRPPFLSDGDLITAWFSQKTFPKKSRPISISNTFEFRSRLKDIFVPGAFYLQNMISVTTAFLSATEASHLSLGKIAVKVRKSIAEQATDAQARSLIRLTKTTLQSGGMLPLFGVPDSKMVVFTNWSKAKIRESANFGPAVISSHRSTSTMNSAATVQPGECVFYWGSRIDDTSLPMDVFYIYGKDGGGNYWMHGDLEKETWDRIQNEFEQCV